MIHIATILMFASHLAPYSVNREHNTHWTSQTTRETIECHCGNYDLLKTRHKSDSVILINIITSPFLWNVCSLKFNWYSVEFSGNQLIGWEPCRIFILFEECWIEAESCRMSWRVHICVLLNEWMKSNASCSRIILLGWGISEHSYMSILFHTIFIWCKEFLSTTITSSFANKSTAE